MLSFWGAKWRRNHFPLEPVICWSTFDWQKLRCAIFASFYVSSATTHRHSCRYTWRCIQRIHSSNLHFWALTKARTSILHESFVDDASNLLLSLNLHNPFHLWTVFYESISKSHSCPKVTCLPTSLESRLSKHSPLEKVASDTTQVFKFAVSRFSQDWKTAHVASHSHKLSKLQQ